MNVQHVCLLVCGGNPKTSIDLDKILYTHPHQSKKGFGAVLMLAPFPP